LPGEAPELGRLAYVMLGVSELNRSLYFYRDVLGLAVTSEIAGFVFLDGRGVTLCLSESLGRGAGVLAGAVEVVFEVSGVQEAFDGLRGRGVSFLRDPHRVTDERWAASFRDPDGHILSIFGPERASPGVH